MPRRGVSLPVFAAAAIAALAYALYTQSAWEDWYITYRASKNLALGYGLVFTPGQRVHSFTSPIGTLLPAFLSWVTGNTNDSLVLWLFRTIAIPAFAMSAVLLVQAARAARFRTFTTMLLGLFIAVDAKMLEFSIDGMETAFDLLFIALMLRALTGGRPRAAMELGIAWGGLMWTRPDAFIHAGGVALGCVLFYPAAAGSSGRADLLRTYAIAGLIASLLYAPWFVWAWWYYGSPVPHPAVAKSLDLAQWPLGLETAMYPLRLLASQAYGDPTFLPFYRNIGGWPRAVLILTTLAPIAGLYWIVPVGSRPVRAASFGFFLSNYYLTVLTSSFPWYYPAAAMVGWFVIAGVIDDILRGIAAAADLPGGARAAVLERGVKIVATLCVAASLMVTAASAFERRVQQRITDEGNRKPMALWLAANGRGRTDTVFLEPLGYVGFFSSLKIYDYPGLSSPEVVAARRAVGDDWAKLIARLDPDWVVLRPSERAAVDRSDPALLADRYDLRRTFDVSDRLRQVRRLPGRPLLEIDQTFFVFHRRAR